jgi:hypothetical protein
MRCLEVGLFLYRTLLYPVGGVVVSSCCSFTLLVVGLFLVLFLDIDYLSDHWLCRLLELAAALARSGSNPYFSECGRACQSSAGRQIPLVLVCSLNVHQRLRYCRHSRSHQPAHH